MQRFLALPLTTAVLGALGEGFVMALFGLGIMLIKHVTDIQTIEGVMIVLLFYPLTVLLKIVMPTIPGLPAFLASRAHQEQAGKEPVYHAPARNDERV